MFRIPYMAAVAEVRKQLKNIPTISKDGVEWIEYNGRQFPKDWFVMDCARKVLDYVEANAKYQSNAHNARTVVACVLKEVGK